MAVGKEETGLKKVGKEKVDAKMVGEAIGEAVQEEVEQEQVVGTESEGRGEMEQYIYIGPNIPGLTTYTVIEGKEKYPIHIKKFVKECAAIDKLFVPVENLAVSEPKTKTKGALENRNYNKVLEYLVNGKKGE